MPVQAKAIAKRVVTAVVPVPVLASLLPFRSPDISESDWQREYQTDAWRYLASASELARYSLITGYCQFFRPGAHVLDVGCGEGLLAERLTPTEGSTYLGIDISSAAIEAARGRGVPNARFETADAERFEPPPDRRFDLLIFNEMLYYLRAPAEQAARYARSLSPDGLVVVSLQDSVRGHQIWSMLRPRFETLDRVRVQHGRLAWRVGVLRPRPPGA